MKSRIVVVGSLNMDLVVNAPRFPGGGETVMGETIRQFCGGKGANQAYAVARLGGDVAMLGQTGADAAGDAQLENLRTSGADTRWISTDTSQPSGTAIILVDASRENRIVVIPGANATFSPTILANVESAFADAAFVLLQLEIPMETVEAAARLARKTGAKLILDPAPAAPLSDELLSMVDYLTPNVTELAALAGRPLGDESSDEEIVTAARSLCDHGTKAVIAKRGHKGAMLVTSQCQHVWPAHSVNAVDTTAAGDAFNGAFAAQLARGATETEAGTFACAAAAIAVTREGAQASMPTRAQVETFLNERSGK